MCNLQAGAGISYTTVIFPSFCHLQNKLLLAGLLYLNWPAASDVGRVYKWKPHECKPSLQVAVV